MSERGRRGGIVATIKAVVKVPQQTIVLREELDSNMVQTVVDNASMDWLVRQLALQYIDLTIEETS